MVERIMPAKEATAQEILKEVDNIKLQVEDTGGVIVSKDGVKYETVMTDFDVTVPYKNVGYIMFNQFKELYNIDDFNFLNLKWSRIVDDIFIGVSINSSETRTSNWFNAVIIYDFNNKTLLNYFKINDLDILKDITDTTAFPFKLVGAHTAVASATVDVPLSFFTDSEYLYIPIHAYNGVDRLSRVLKVRKGLYSDITVLNVILTSTNSEFIVSGQYNTTFRLVGDLLIKTTALYMFLYKAIRDSNGEITSFEQIKVNTTGINYGPSNVGASYTRFYTLIHLKDDIYFIVLSNNVNNVFFGLLNITQTGLITNIMVNTSSVVTTQTLQRDEYQVFENDGIFHVALHFTWSHTLMMKTNTLTYCNGGVLTTQSSIFDMKTPLSIISEEATNSTQLVMLYGRPVIRYLHRSMILDSKTNLTPQYNASGYLATSYMSILQMVTSSSIDTNGTSLSLLPMQSMMLTDGRIISRHNSSAVSAIYEWRPAKFEIGFIEKED